MANIDSIRDLAASGNVGNKISLKISVAQKKVARHWQFYVMAALPLAYIIIFKYVPMAGAQIAFRDYSPITGIWKSEWIGLDNFKLFMGSPNFPRLIRNTLAISALELTVGFLSPILLALGLNEIRNGSFKRSVQMITYFPHFISTVVMASMIIIFLSPRIGFVGPLTDLINVFIDLLKGIPFLNNLKNVTAVDYMGVSKAFPTVYVLSNIWQHAGFAAIIYIAALAGINPELYEAARIDGASRLQKIINIDIPGILPTIVVLLILQSGEVMNIGFEKIFLLQNSLNIENSDVFATYVYRVGLVDASFSYGTAIGLFNSVLNLLLLLTMNSIARRVSEHSLW